MVASGLLLAIAGVAVYLGWFNWFGKLPGDVQVDHPRVRVHFPIVTMLVVSIVLTIALNLLARFFK